MGWCLHPPSLPACAPQLATAGVQPCGSWLSRYYAAVERQLEEGAWGGGDLANLLWGLAKFDLMPEVGGAGGSWASRWEQVEQEVGGRQQLAGGK